MPATTPAYLMDISGPVFERCVAGPDMVLYCRGMAVASFRQGDSIGRAIAIATLLRVGGGLKTDTIAELCGASHGGVCDVRRRLAEGGLDQVVEGARRGAPRKVVGVHEARLREMHAEGAGVREIAAALGVSKSLVATEIKRLKLSRDAEQGALPMSASPMPPARIDPAPSDAGLSVDETSDDTVEQALLQEVDDAEAAAADVVDMAVDALEGCEEATPSSRELVAGAPLASGPAEHPCRYAGTLLLCAAAAVLGLFSALDAAHVVRPAEAVYDAHQVYAAMLAAWGAGYGSLEAMHERDARALGVILGLERSPSVRTLHRALKQTSERSDILELNAALIRGVLSARLPERLWFGVDGHFKAYSGDEPIDKGWDSKRHLAAKGVADVVTHDARGFTWLAQPVAAGSPLSQHLAVTAHTLRSVLGSERPVVVSFDRGGFDFDALDELARDGFYYVGYVPASVALPDTGAIAPATDGVGEVEWTHERLHHPARLIVEREGTSLIPVATNLPTLVDTAFVVQQLRIHRGTQENSFKAARSFAHIDRLVDRGGASHAPDDRLIPNPARAALKNDQRRVTAHIAALAEETPSSSGRSRKDIHDDRFWAEVESARLKRALHTTPAKVSRVTVEPDALRAELKTRRRQLLQPLKFLADNARRWLLGTLGNALAPSDKPHDLETNARTLLALLRAPGTVRFDDAYVTVTVDLPLPPTPHARLAAALGALDAHALLFTDGRRRLRFRLAPRPTRADIPGHA
jgi:transposase